MSLDVRRTSLAVVAVSTCWLVAAACSSFDGSGPGEPADAATSSTDSTDDSTSPPLDVGTACPGVVTTSDEFVKLTAADPPADVRSDASNVFWRTRRAIHRLAIDRAGPTSDFEAGEDVNSLVLSSQYVSHLRGSTIVTHPKSDLSVTNNTDSNWTALYADSLSTTLVGIKGALVDSIQPPGLSPTTMFPDMAVNAVAFSPGRILLYGSRSQQPAMVHTYPESDAGIAGIAIASLATNGSSVFYIDGQSSLFEIPFGGGASSPIALFQPAPSDRLELVGSYLYYRTPQDIRRVDTVSHCVDIIATGSFGSFSVSSPHVFLTTGPSILDVKIAP